MTDHPAAGARRGETREEIVARVVREQLALNPTPAYDSRAKRRLRRYLYVIWPVGILVGLIAMWALGWSWTEGIGFGVAFGVALWYLGLLFVTERDDGRIQRQVRQVRERLDDGR